MRRLMQTGKYSLGPPSPPLYPPYTPHTPPRPPLYPLPPTLKMPCEVPRRSGYQRRAFGGPPPPDCWGPDFTVVAKAGDGTCDVAPNPPKPHLGTCSDGSLHICECRRNTDLHIESRAAGLAHGDFHGSSYERLKAVEVQSSMLNVC